MFLRYECVRLCVDMRVFAVNASHIHIYRVRKRSFIPDDAVEYLF